MRLDHILAGDPLGSALSDEQRTRARGVLRAFGFAREDESWVLDASFPWATVQESDGVLRAYVTSPLPPHLVETVHAALEGLVLEAALVRIDLLTRGQLVPTEWARRVAASVDASRKGEF